MALATIIVLLLAVTKAYGTEAYLEILPAGETQTRPVGSSIILTCKPKVEDTRLITDLQWFDPHNRPINSSRTEMSISKSGMYVEEQLENTMSLFFSSLQEDQAGKYSCRANYANNIPLNKSVNIETIVAITWIDAPQTQNPILGEDYSIRCQVLARPSPTVDWRYNGRVIKTNDHYIIETHALRIINVQESDDGIYTCRAFVITTGEIQERPIRVEVHKRPTVSEFPSAVEIIEGERAEIVCKGTGKPSPKFTWTNLFSQKNLSNFERFHVDPETGVLTINSVKREDDGKYRCKASNPAGIAMTDVTLKVIVKPKILRFENSTSLVKKEATLSCHAFGLPSPEITFRKHTANKSYVLGEQSNEPRISLTNKPLTGATDGETIGTITIEDTLRSDDGLYECIAQNSGGIVYKTGHLTITFPPSFASMRNATVWSWDRKPVNLTCIAESIPNATITWSYGDREIKNDQMIKQFGNGPISILQIKPNDRRYYTIYRCNARNVHGIATHDIILSEAQRPGDLIQVKTLEITPTTIKFQLIPPSTHPDLPIRTITTQFRDSYEPQVNSKNKTWSLGSLYVVEDLKPNTRYEFRFAASNEVGLGSWSQYYEIMTYVKTYPNQPKLITNGEEYDLSPQYNQYTLSWIVPAHNGEPIDLYQVKYCQVKRIAGQWEVQEDTCVNTEIKLPDRTYFVLKDLYPDTFYRVEISAHNVLGYSTPAVTLFKTNRGNPAVVHHRGSLLSSGAIIGIIIAIVFIIIAIIDIVCCCAHQNGIIYYLRERSRRKPVDEEGDSKLGRDEKEPLKEEKKITPIIDSGLRRETSITFDGKKSVSKTGFVGKDSAV